MAMNDEEYAAFLEAVYSDGQGGPGIPLDAITPWVCPECGETIMMSYNDGVEKPKRPDNPFRMHVNVCKGLASRSR